MSGREPFNLTSSTALKHGALLLAGYLVGYLNDAPWSGLCIALTAALTWHLYHLIKLQHWLQRKPPGPIPIGGGTWPRVFARILHFRTRSATLKQQTESFNQIWQTFVETLPDAAFILTSDYEVLAANTQAARALDIDPARITGPITNYLRQPEFLTFLRSGKHNDTVDISTPKEPDITLQCRLSPCDNDHLLLQLLDISEQVKAQQMRTDFVANASHELRTPVTVLKGYLDSFVDDDTLPQEMRAPVGVMNEQINRMQAIISDLMALNVLESGGQAPMDTVIDVAKIMQGVEREALALPKRPQSFRFVIDAGLNLRGSRSDFHSIASNLVSNAVRFTPGEGSVVVRWVATDTGASLIVEDSGIGIDEDDVPRVTERFYRTEAGKNRHQFGTGLGLAIVKHALARHDAQLSIRSRYHEGSTFTCTFPAHRLAASAETTGQDK